MSTELDAALQARLLAAVRGLAGFGEAGFAVGPKPLAGGRFSSVWQLALANVPSAWRGPLVLRVVEDRRQAVLESALHQGARSGGITAPGVLLTDLGDGEPSFLVMERMPGRSYLRGVEPWKFAIDLPKLLTQWPRRLERVMAALGAVDVDAVRRVCDEHGLDPAETASGRHLERVTTTLARDRAHEESVAWLRAHAPPPPARSTLVHGDLWPANVFIGSSGVALIDWTNGAIGDPALDVGFAKVGWQLMPQPFPPPPPFAQVAALAGRSVARRLSARCDHLVGGAARVRYYEALRCAVEIANTIEAAGTGERSGWAPAVPALVEHLERVMEEGVPW